MSVQGRSAVASDADSQTGWLALCKQPSKPLQTCSASVCHFFCAMCLPPQVASFFSWQPAVAPEQLVDIINTHLQEQWTAGWADAASGTAADSYTSSSPSSNSPGSRSSSRNSCTEAAAELRDSHSGSQQASEVQPPMCPLRVWQAEIVPRQFHPTFAASWRRYVYLWPLQEVPTGVHR